MTESGAAKAAALADGEVVHAGLAEIAKWEDGPDGTLYVYGKATTPEVDTDDQIVDGDFSGKALREWLDEAPAVRVMHSATTMPAGSGVKVEVNRDGDGAHWVKAAVDEPVAQRMVRKGHLRAFSVGIARPVIERDPSGRARGGIIKGGRIVEVSLVDSPANRSCWLEVAKAAGSGAAEFTGKVFGAESFLAKEAAPRIHKTVSVELPANMRLRVTPADLAKMNTLAKLGALGDRLRADEAATKAATLNLVGEKGPELYRHPGAGEPDAAFKRDVDTAERRSLAKEHRALPDGFYPIESEEDAENALTLAYSHHGDWKAALKLVRRVAKKEGWTKILDRMKRVKDEDQKASKASGADAKVTRDIARARADQEKDPDDKTDPEDRKVTRDLDAAARAQAADNDGERAERKKKAKKARKTADARKAPRDKTARAKAQKKARILCGACGARQSAKHMKCSECGGDMAGSLPVTKNHVFTCLGCGKEQDKGEKFCPQCGTANPGYLPEADHQIPANRKTAGAAAVKKRKKGRSPADGVEGQHTMPLPPHREPDGPALDAFERSAGLMGDEPMRTAMRHKNAGIPADLGALHDLTCPAYHPADVTKAIPHATFGVIDTAAWETKALEAATAAGTDPAGMIAAWENAAALSRHAVTLKTADPQLIQDLRREHHAAFAAANRKRLGLSRRDVAKTFHDATPGPGHAPTPGHPTPGDYKRPYIGAGHAADSPQHDGPRVFPVPHGQVSSQDYTRGYLDAGHAADSPSNGDRGLPEVPSEGGKPGRVFYANSVRDNARQALLAMHDHISRLFPDICLMSPDVDDVQKPAPPVPAGVGGPVPHAGKSSRPKTAKARKGAKVKARSAAQRKTAKARAVAPDSKAIRAAVKSATTPLVKQQAQMGKTIRRQQRALDAIASARDTTGAPFRGAGVAKSASAAPAGPLTMAGAAEQYQAGTLAELIAIQRESHNPAEREAARKAMTSMLGKAGLTQ